jgi:tripartite-type tricarboxylate transporter receptor subunit TctC
MRPRRAALLLIGLVVVVTGTMLLPGWSPRHRAGDFPNRPIKLVVPFAPGGGTDTFARIMKKAIEDNDLLPQPIVIINLDGAGATIGSRRVKNARPDGYTILLLHEAIVTAKYSGNALYGPEAFEPIAGTGRMGLVFAVAEDSEYQSLTDLVEAAQMQPDTLVFAANLGAPVHFVGLMLEQQCPGATFRFTQTGGGTKRLHALKGGHAQVSAFSIEEYSRFKAAGIRAIAYCDTERHPAIPDVPTSHEQGIAVTHVNMQFWWAPKNTPQSRVDYLGDVLEKAMQTESVQARMAQIKCDPVVVRGAAMLAEVEARRVAISSVDLRKTQALPNVPAFVIPLVVVMGVIVFLKSRHQVPSPAKAVPVVRNDLAMWCTLATIVYLVVLSTSIVDFRLVTFAYVLAVGGVLTGWQPQRLMVLIAVAAVMSNAVHFLFTRVFDLVLP